MTSAPQRVVCLSAESADWLWRLGAWDQVVGVTAFFEPPADAAPKSRVSGFSSANRGAIIWLQPDLVVTFSDVQAALTTELIQAGLSVLATNQRTLAEIESTLALLARAVGRESEGERLLCEFRRKLAPIPFPTARPRVYFEEWNDPLITGIAWVSEVIERAGGEDIFADVRNQRSAAFTTKRFKKMTAPPNHALHSAIALRLQACFLAGRSMNLSRLGLRDPAIKGLDGGPGLEDCW